MRALICAIVKDEHRDIREWVDYHVDLGIDRIVLYDNNSTEPYDLPEVEWREWKTDEDHRQRHVYDHFIASEVWGDDDWCAFIDADEFIRLEADSIHRFLRRYDDAGGVVLSWRCFGADGRVKRPDLPVQEAYLKPVSLIRERHNFKSVVKLSQFEFWADVHRAATRRPLVRVSGEPVYASEVPQTIRAGWLDHYITKSWEDYVQRLKRGNITRGIRRVEHFFAYNPDMLSQAFHLTAKLNFSEFPTLNDERQQERIERLDHLFGVAERLDSITDGVMSNRQFHNLCAFELMKLGEWQLTRSPEDERERLRPRFMDLINRQLAFFQRVPCDFDGYYETIISNLISTPFERIARQA